jgi:hypothetical protein
MFFKWFRRKEPDADVLAAQLSKQSEMCINQIKGRWLYYNKTFVFKPEVRFSEIIETFSIPMREFVHQSYPMLLVSGEGIFWMMLFSAIQQSGTHDMETLNNAVAEIEKKYIR